MPIAGPLSLRSAAHGARTIIGSNTGGNDNGWVWGLHAGVSIALTKAG